MKIKKLLATLISACLVVAMIPTTAFAADSKLSVNSFGHLGYWNTSTGNRGTQDIIMVTLTVDGKIVAGDYRVYQHDVNEAYNAGVTFTPNKNYTLKGIEPSSVAFDGSGNDMGYVTISLATNYFVTYSNDDEAKTKFYVDETAYPKGTQVAIIGDVPTKESTDPENYEHVFDGWTVDNTAGGAFYESGDTFTMGNSSLNLVAVFHKVSLPGSGTDTGEIDVAANHRYHTNEVLHTESYVPHKVSSGSKLSDLIDTKNPDYNFLSAIVRATLLDTDKQPALQMATLPIPKTEAELEAERIANEAKPDGEVKPDTEVKPDGEVKPDTEVKPDSEVKPDTEAKPDGEVKPDAEVKPDGEVKPDAEVKADSAAPVVDTAPSGGATVQSSIKFNAISELTAALEPIDTEIGSPEEAANFIFQDGYSYEITINYNRDVQVDKPDPIIPPPDDNGNDNGGGDVGGGGDTTFIPDGNIPLGNLPSNIVTIVDTKMPLGNLPTSGGMSKVLALTGVLLLVVGVLVTCYKRKEQDNAE